MKQIMTFELYKSTYMSAADKLEKGHKTRAEELKKHADEIGISAFRGKEGFDMIHPHTFIFENYRGLEKMERAKGKFFITDYSDVGGYRSGFNGVDVIMKSDYGNTITLELVVGPNNFVKLDLEFEGGYTSKNFLFNNRKDAIEFRKFVLEIASYEITNGELYFNLNTLPINELYTTE